MNLVSSSGLLPPRDSTGDEFTWLRTRFNASCPDRPNAFEHGKRGFPGVVESKKKSGSDQLKGLDERTVRLIVIDHVHLYNKSIRIFKKKSFVVLIGSANQIFPVSSFFIVGSFLFRQFS